MWQPMSQQEFESLYSQQESELSTEERDAFDRFRTPVSKATIWRSESAGDEQVFVVARTADRGVLYFDDVEFGFNISTVDDDDVILQPGGSQFSLAQAVRAWMMPADKNVS